MIRDKSYVKTGGSSNKSLYKLLKKVKRNRTKKQKGSGNGCVRQEGGRVVKPNEYYGGDSGRYFADGSKQLIPEDSAYGITRAVSFGNISNDMTTTGPNLGPYPNSSGMMTGGKRRNNKNRTSKRRISKRSNSKRSNSKRHN